MAPGGGFRLHPESIKFTQDSIKAQFMDGRELTCTLEELLNGRKTVDDIPPIEVVEDLEDYGWWALTGNRRLYLYRKLEQLGVVETIPVIKMAIWDYGVSGRLSQRRTTFCNGRDIRLRGGQGEWQINQIIERYRLSRPSIPKRNEQPDTNSIHPTIDSPTPKKESEMTADTQKEEVPLEQFTSNQGTAESEEDVTCTIEEDNSQDEETAFIHQPLKKRSYTRNCHNDGDGWFLFVFLFLLLVVLLVVWAYAVYMDEQSWENLRRRLEQIRRHT